MYPNPEVVSLRQRAFPTGPHSRSRAPGIVEGRWRALRRAVDADHPGRRSSGGRATPDRRVSSRRRFPRPIAVRVGASAFANGRFTDAEKLFLAVAEKYPNSEAAPEAIYLDRRRALQGIGECCGTCRHGARVPRQVSTKQLGQESIRLGEADGYSCEDPFQVGIDGGAGRRDVRRDAGQMAARNVVKLEARPDAAPAGDGVRFGVRRPRWQ